MMPEFTRSYNFCATLATASAYTAMTTRTTASTSTSSSNSSSSTVFQLRQTQQQLTPRRPSVTCVSSPRVSASCWCLAGARVSVFSVLTLWSPCRPDVRCVVHLCVCTVDVYLANLNVWHNAMHIVRHSSNLTTLWTADIAYKKTFENIVRHVRIHVTKFVLHV